MVNERPENQPVDAWALKLLGWKNIKDVRDGLNQYF